MREAYWYLGRKERPVKALPWNLNWALWLASSYLHFSDQDIFSIWAYYVPHERGRGLGNASLYYFNKPLSDLDEHGLAALLAAVRSPSRFKPVTGISDRRIKAILESKEIVPSRDAADRLQR